MIEPYFAVWLRTTKELAKEEPLLKNFPKAWNTLVIWEKCAVAVLFASIATVSVLGFATMFDRSFLRPYLVSFVVFLVFVGVLDRVTVLRDRRVPQWNIESKDKANTRLRKNLKEIGLKNAAQLSLVMDEAIRVLDRKEHRRETVVHIVIEVVILAALVWALNFLTNLLEHGLPLEQIALLAGATVVVSVSFVLLIAVGWRAVDNLGPLPVRRLHMFVDDLSRLLIEETGTLYPAEQGQSPARQHLRNHRVRKHFL